MKFLTIPDPQPYEPVLKAMRNLTLSRDADSQNEIWFLEHQPVFTQGQAGRQEHILNPGDIPVVQSDRGGQVTYHGPGQLMIYCLLDVRQLNLGVRAYVTALETTFIELLGGYGLEAIARPDAPGVYLQPSGAKIASIGIRIRKGCCYHGVSFNLDLDLSPFQRINPCGYQNLPVAKLSDYVPGITRLEVEAKLKPLLIKHLNPHTPCKEYVA